MFLRDKTWWKAAGLRVLKTFAQAAVGLIPAAVTIAEVDWLTVLYSSALAAVLAFLTAFAGLPEVDGAKYGKVRAALYRALRTVAQTAIGMIPAAATIVSVDWKTVLSASLLAGVVSVLMTVANLAVPEVKWNDSDVGQEDLSFYREDGKK
jgi:hypothetical protein